MAGHETTSDVDKAAACWAARLDRFDLDQSDQDALDRWLGENTRHVGALARAQAVLVRLDMASALGADFGADVVSSELVSRHLLSRRRLLGAGAAAAATAASAAWFAFRNSFTTYTTAKGEVRLIPLADGSVITLNTASRVDVRLGNQRRDLRLVTGEALFEVAKDRHRPFLVQVGSASVEAVGTAFTVRNTQELLIVDVQEGVVRMKSAEVEFEPQTLVANMRAETHLRGGALHITRIDPVQQIDDLAWRDGRIAFHGETLRKAADAFARYSDTQIGFADNKAATRTITGYYSVTDVIGFAKAASESLDLSIDVKNGKVFFSSKDAETHRT